MYNSKEIDIFIEKCYKEAGKAAQDVLDKYEPELRERIKRQMRAGDKFFIGMGTASFKNKKDNYVGEELALVLSSTQYWDDTVKAGFNLTDIIKPL